jgi:hypothetical protein
MARSVLQLHNFTFSLSSDVPSIGRSAARIGLAMPAATRWLAKHVWPQIGRLAGAAPRAAPQQMEDTKPAAVCARQRASPEAHMSRIAAVIWDLAARFKLAEDYQSAAALQIDAALYDIERLRADLEASIGLTLAVAGLLPATHLATLQPVTASGVPRPRRVLVTVGRAAVAQSAA